MTNEEIIEMARQAGGIDLTNTRANVTIWVGTGTSDFLDAFAKLVEEKAIKEALAQPEQEPVAWEQFYPDIGKPQIEQPKVRTGDCLLVVVCASEGHKIQKAQPEQDNTYIYASNLAKTIWQKHYIKESPRFALLDTTEGVLTQIDNMACGLVREKPAQPEQKYHRGDRLICLETEEYCVIHISGTDRQWVKFPDSHIGVYTNELVAELFELLPKEPEQEPVGQLLEDAFGRGQVMWFNKPKDESMLYTSPPRKAGEK